MDLRPTPDQELLRSSARDFLARHCPLERLAQRELAGSGVDLAVWSAMADLGWLGLALPEELGGSGGTLADLGVLAEELGRQLCPEPVLPVVVAAAALDAAVPDNARTWLREVASGARRPVLAAADSSGRWEHDGRGTTFESGAVNGERWFVEGALGADTLLVTADDRDRGVVLLGVDVDQPGVTIEPHHAIVGGVLGKVTFSRAHAWVLSIGWSSVAHALTTAGALAAAWSAGAGARLLEDTVAYARERVQFGVPIGSFQAVQHQLADAAIAIAEGGTLARHAADALHRRDPAGCRLASTAYVRATEAFVFASRRCHQVWGGMGFSTETHVHHFSRRAKLMQHAWGGPLVHLEVIANELWTAPLLRDRYPLANEGAA